MSGSITKQNNLIVFAEAFVLDLNYADSQSFSGMVSDVNIFLPRVEIGIRILYVWLLPNGQDTRFSGESRLFGMGLGVGEAFEDHWVRNLFYPIIVIHSNIFFTSIFTSSVSNEHEPLRQTRLGS
jgi:hypothetical protein